MVKEITLYKEKNIAQRGGAAQRLRDLADLIESGKFMLGAQAVALPDAVSLKIEVDPDDDEVEVEIELRWEPWAEMPITGLFDAEAQKEKDDDEDSEDSEEESELDEEE